MCLSSICLILASWFRTFFGSTLKLVECLENKNPKTLDQSSDKSKESAAYTCQIAATVNIAISFISQCSPSAFSVPVMGFADASLRLEAISK